MSKLNNNNKYIHQNYNVGNHTFRMYDSHTQGLIEMFHNEICVYYSRMAELGLKIYFLKSEAVHDIKFSQDDLNYFKNSRNNADMLVPDNILKLRDLQSQDLLYFYDFLPAEDFWFLSQITDNFYHFDMLLCTQENFNIEEFLKIKFNVVKFKSVTPIFEKNLTYNYMGTIFNFDILDNYMFYNQYEEKYENLIWNPEFKKTQEYKDLEKYEEEQLKFNNLNRFDLQRKKDPQYLYYYNNYLGKKSELLDQRLLFTGYFRKFGWHWFILNRNFDDYEDDRGVRIYSYPINEPFVFKQLDILKPIATVDISGNITPYREEVDGGCMFDLLDNLNDCNNYCVGSYVISVPKIIYGTGYKIRLQQNKII